MSLIIIERTANLNGPIIPDSLAGVLNGGEIDAHKFVISATRDGEAVALAGTVTATFLRADGAEVALTGEIENGAAAVTLAQSCYAVPGRFDLTIFVTDSGVKTGVYACSGSIRNTTSGTIIDPGEIVPDVDAIVAQYGEMQRVTEETQAAADAANAAAEGVSGEIADLKSAFEDSVSNEFPLWAENFSVGNISISGSGWQYFANAQRVRTNEGFTIHLYPGDIIALSDYTDARMYIGWQRLDGVYNSSGGWLTSDFTAFDAGEYVILLSNAEQKTQTNVYGLLSLLHIKQHTIKQPNAFDSMTFKVANHQGYTPTAPNNTLPAFTMSKIMGYDIVETDVRFTSDNVPVLSHDDDISGHSNGTGNISQMTYAQLEQYDFGSWKNAKYTGTKIPTFADFLNLCRSLGLNAYVELKVCDETQASILTELVSVYGMEKHITWIGVASLLKYIVQKMPYSRIGLIIGTDDDATKIAINYNSLVNMANDVFVDVQYGVYTRNTYYNAIVALGCPVEVWTLDAYDYFYTQPKVKNVTGVTTNSMLYWQLALDNATSGFDPGLYKMPTIKAFSDLLNAT